MIENQLDILFIVVIAVSVLFGLFRGLIRAVFGILSLVFAFFASKYYASLLFDTTFNLFGASFFSVAIAHVFVFFIVWLLCGVAASFFYKALRKMDMGGIDNIGGMLFGFIRGVFYAVLFTAAMALTPFQNTTTWQQSIILPMVGIAMQVMFNLPKIKDYQSYWSFHNNRPQFMVDSSFEQHFLESVKEPHDNELDEAVEAEIKQSLHGEQVAEDIAIPQYEKSKQDAPLQRMNVLLQEIFSTEEVDVESGENCQKGEESACAE